MDLLPTFCRLAGVEPPGDRVLDGHDLSAVLLGQTDRSPRDTVFYWRQEELYAVRSGPWKAHFITEGCFQDQALQKREAHAPPLLYHLENDPSERNEVGEAHPDVIEKITKLAEQHRQSIQPMENQLAKR